MYWKNGLFFPIRNPDGDDLPIEPQTVYAMFSMDKINVYLQETANVGTVQYAAGGLIPELERGNSKTFRDRVQAFTVQPNPRREGDGSTVNGDGWWWRQDYIKFNLFDKEGYLAQVQFPINQGSWSFQPGFILLLPIAVPIRCIWERNSMCNCLSITIGR